MPRVQTRGATPALKKKARGANLEAKFRSPLLQCDCTPGYTNLLCGPSAARVGRHDLPNHHKRDNIRLRREHFFGRLCELKGSGSGSPFRSHDAIRQRFSILVLAESVADFCNCTADWSRPASAFHRSRSLRIGAGCWSAPTLEDLARFRRL